MYLRIGEAWYFLVTVFDAYSRYAVHWELLITMTTADVRPEALRKHPPRKPTPKRTSGYAPRADAQRHVATARVPEQQKSAKLKQSPRTPRRGGSNPILIQHAA